MDDVERKVHALDLGCSNPSYFIEGESHVKLSFECNQTKVEADVRREWRYLKVRMEVRGN